MADNYLENKFEELQARKAKEQRAKQIAWKKRMDAYRKTLEAEAAAKREVPEPDADINTNADANALKKQLPPEP